MMNTSEEDVLRTAQTEVATNLSGHIDKRTFSENTNLNQMLIQAANQGNPNEVRRLIEEENVNPNARTPFGATALMCAANNGFVYTAKILIESGTDVNTQD